ncbi:50S ribosomal protein L11 [Candidatus Falkowbacteria bacterium]|nr:50S ribosomal protein L11 [Candidatus Falkowbacteria bacterium]
MAKKILTQIKLQIAAGKANPAPPVGPALGQHGLNIQDFCNRFNTATKDKDSDIIPVVITVFEDRTFDFICKTPPASVLIKKMLKLDSGSKSSGLTKVGKLTKAQLKEIAELKMQDMNTKDINAAMNTIAGTARQMGVTVEE